MENKVWFITGTSRGFGKIWAKAALKRGDKVAATARNTDSLDDLVEEFGESILPIKLDVNNRQEGIEAVNKANEHFGRIDVLINNAGYGLFGAIEENSEEEVRAQFETNFFGALWITQAAIPIMRAQGSGHIIQTSSIGGVATFPTLGVYNASKWALEAVSEAMASEVAPQGIKVTIVEPGGYATDWGGASAKQSNSIKEYTPIKENLMEMWKTIPMGNPEATDEAILKIVDSENPPLRLFLGAVPNQIIKDVYAKRLKEWDDWNDVSVKAQGSM
ncbi:MAG: SDR family oxidoreductase [Melioribacteraceae bacterium]|nr:SDR family oxidoreductase [Melioribacteraceae bacterium]